MKTLGIIDIGSNSIKLIIVEINNNSYREVFHKKFQTRLSEFVGKESKGKNVCGQEDLVYHLCSRGSYLLDQGAGFHF